MALIFPQYGFPVIDLISIKSNSARVRFGLWIFLHLLTYRKWPTDLLPILFYGAGDDVTVSLPRCDSIESIDSTT